MTSRNDYRLTRCDVGQVKRIVLPDDVLLEIFDFYVMHLEYAGKKGTEEWQSLVHVCRRWRSLVLGSPRRLNLELYCTPNTPTRDTLDVWPALPLIVRGDYGLRSGTDNIIAALGQSNRVCQVILWGITKRQLEEVLASMQVPFPELTDLQLLSYDETLSAILVPDSFLGGSAPRLRVFGLRGIPFPGLPKLLSYPKRWSLSSPFCPASRHFTSNSIPLNLALAGKAEIYLHQNALSSLLSDTFNSEGLPNI